MQRERREEPMRRYAELNRGKRSAALPALVVMTLAAISTGPALGGALGASGGTRAGDHDQWVRR